MRIAYITAGAAGMICGSCLHDNTLVTALQAQGHDAILIPTYTPIKTDERDVSESRVFFGGLNVFLQQKFAFFRRTPWFLDRLLDSRGLLRFVSRFAGWTSAEDLGDLTISMLEGDHGRQRKEVLKLCNWLAQDLKPDLVNLTNVLLGGFVPELKRELKVPVLGTLQGDDIFLDSLDPEHRGRALNLLREGCRHFDGFVATSSFYADYMAGYLAIPREKIHVIYPGLNLNGHGGERAPRTQPPYTIGYFARICPEKGLHVLVQAFQKLREMPGVPPCRLRVSGWLGASNRIYFDNVLKGLRSIGLGDDFEHLDCPDHASKVRFLQSLDVLSVPTTYREPKGLYVLEALANGVPVVQPRHGSFPELLERTGGGLLVNPDDPDDLASALRRMLDDTPFRLEAGRRGKEVVFQKHTAAIMAQETVDLYRRYLP